jgi:hypothetical protein
MGSAHQVNVMTLRVTSVVHAFGAMILVYAVACNQHAFLDDACASLTRGINFAVAPTISLGMAPNAFAVADFDGDGRLDIAAASRSTVVVSFARDGSLVPGTEYSAGVAVAGLVTGDFDRDGKIDIAVANRDGAAWLRGHGDGSFDMPVSFPTGGAASAIVSGDFNHDGAPDLAVLGSEGRKISVLLGNGDGSFQPARPYAMSSDAAWLASGDVDGNGKLDLIAISSKGFVVPFFGNGDGSFRPSTMISLAPAAKFLAAATGDFNSDGKLDLVIARHTQDCDSVSVALGQGDGTFTWAGGIAGEKLSPTNIAVGDLDGDGKLDIVAGVDRDSNVTTRLGNGDGHFGPSAGHSVAGGIVVVLDIDGDGKGDVLRATSTGIAVLMSNGDGTLHAPRAFAVQGPVRRLAIGDFNHDGTPDVAITYAHDLGCARVLLSDGHGGLCAAPYRVIEDSSTYAEIAAADLNGDGNTDLVSADGAAVLLGEGNGAFQPKQGGGGPRSRAMAMADFDGDGAIDLAQYTPGRRGVAILMGNGDGSFRQEHTIAIDGVINMLAAADLDADGKPDLAASTDAGMLVLFGTGEGTFEPPQGIAGASSPGAIVVADLNHDSRLDLVVAHHDATSTVLLNMGQRTFLAVSKIAAAGSLRVSDVDGDGHLDLVVQSGSTSIFRGRGDGTFVLAGSFDVSGTDFALADMNQDGLPELLVVSGSTPVLTVVQNISR